jgi:hypothetical protein
MNQPITKIQDYRPPAAPISFTSWTPTFVSSVAEMRARVEAKRQFMREVMIEGEHYGWPPGMEQRAGAKPFLFKAGAELLLTSFGLSPELTDAEPPVRDYDGAQHGGVPLLNFRERCRVYKQIGPAVEDRILIAQADGCCSSRETKYRYREGGRKCVTCGKATIIKGKEEYGGGWVCFAKKGGCGEKYLESDQRITSQQVGRIENPDIADVENTVLKMAQKRAYVAATLLATGCSDIFTQDEDCLEGETMHNVTPRSTPAPSAVRETAPTADEIAARAALSEAARAAFAIAVKLDLVPDDKTAFREYCKQVYPGMGWHEVLAVLESAPKAHRSDTEPAPSFSSTNTEATPNLHRGHTEEKQSVIDDDVLQSLAGNVPMIDMRMLASVAETCGMGEHALRAVVREVTDREMLTSGTFSKVFNYVENYAREMEA